MHWWEGMIIPLVWTLFLCLSWYVLCLSFHTECKCVCTCSSACWCEGLKDTWPGTRFSRLRVVTGSKPCGPQTALPSFPITKSSSSFTLSVSPYFSLSHTLFSSLSSSLRCGEALTQQSFPPLQLDFPCRFPPCYGPLRITWGDQFGVISTIWTMKLLHLRVFVKIWSQEVLLVCWEVSHTVWCEVKFRNEV